MVWKQLIVSLILITMATSAAGQLPEPPEPPLPPEGPGEPGVPAPRDPIEEHWGSVPQPDPAACEPVVKVQEAGFGGTVTWLGEQELAYIHPAPIPFDTRYSEGSLLEPISYVFEDDEPRDAQRTVADYARQHGVPISQDPLFRDWRADLLVTAVWEENVTTWQFIEHVWYATPETGASYMLEGKGEPAEVCDDATTVYQEPPPHPRDDYDAWIPATVQDYIENGVPAPVVEANTLHVSVRFASYQEAETHPRMEGDAASAALPDEVEPDVEATIDDFEWPAPFFPDPPEPGAGTGTDEADGRLDAPLLALHQGHPGNWLGPGDGARQDGDPIPETDKRGQETRLHDSDAVASSTETPGTSISTTWIVAVVLGMLLLATVAAALSPLWMARSNVAKSRAD